ncbi:MAG: primosomal protein N' [Negativicutes bacterium]|nr:primosomal protein N' [Negativicutes bacterium]
MRVKTEVLVAQVAVLVEAVDQALDYIIPDELAMIGTGWRVAVPLAGNVVEGIVVGRCEYSRVTDGRLKAIIEPVGDGPWFNEEMLATARWLADFYFCPPAVALRQFIPTGKGLNLGVFYRVAGPRPGSPRLAAVYDCVAIPAKVSRRELLARFGPKVADVLAELVRHGHVRMERTIIQRGRPKTRTAWKINPDSAHLVAEEQALARKKPAQARALSYIRRAGEISDSELASAGISRAVVNRLVADGWLIRLETEVRRQPHTILTANRVTVLSHEQQQAVAAVIEAVASGRHRTLLLHGVTGSGKTQVYIEAAAAVASSGRQVIVLVPEIALTGQIVARFRQVFGDLVVVMHSRLSLGERFDAARAVSAGQAIIVIGARSAVFAPVRQLGLVIVDEEHEHSYKQEEYPYFNAVTVAEQRARIAGVPLILGSATPSLTSYWRATSGDYRLITMARRVKNYPPPEIQLVDMRAVLKSGHRQLVSPALASLITGVLARREQAIIMLNRRGYATFIICRDCGHKIECPNCAVSLVYHVGNRAGVTCHYCGFRQQLPGVCPQCFSPRIRWFGGGTQRLEEEIKQLAGEDEVRRLDADSVTRRYLLDKILSDFANQKFSILLGTQLVAKGHDFPAVTAVGIVAADGVLGLPDFRSAERTFSLITQAAGRAGRSEKPGRVVVQAYDCEHYALVAAVKGDYREFFRTEIAFRRELGYPPVSSMVKLAYSASNPDDFRLAGQTVERVLAPFRQCSGGRISPAMPAPIEKINKNWRGQVLLFDIDQHQLAEIHRELAVAQSGSGKWRYSFDRDPLSVL